MNVSTITTWIKENKIITLAIGLAVAGAAVYFGRKAYQKPVRTLSGYNQRKKINRRQIALVGLK